jgi:putative heme-binding domain-containing protein
MWRKLFGFILALGFAAGPLVAQHSYSPADVEDGGRIFRTNCTNCHGANGDAIPTIDLGRGRFRQQYSDSDLIRIIRNGIPGTPMPANNFDEFRATTVVAYLRSMAADVSRPGALVGDAARGKALFAGKGECFSCHRVKGVGSRSGPDLTEIGTMRRSTEFERAMLEPDAEVLAGNRIYRAVAKDGTEITGLLLNQDAFSVQMLDARDRLRNLAKADLKQMGFLEKSTMPSYRDKFSAQELADVVSYLTTLKGLDQP